MLATANTHKKTRKKTKHSEEVLEKMQVNELEGSELARKKSLALGIIRMAIYRPAPVLKGRTFELLVLNGWVFNFCVRSTPTRKGGVGGGGGVNKA